MFNFFRRKNNNEEITQKAFEQDILLNKNTKETLEIAEDVIKKLSSKLEDSVRQVSRIGSIIQDSMIMTDSSGIIESVNKTALEMFKYERDLDLIGKSLSILFDIPEMDFMKTLLTKHDNKKYFHEDFEGVKKTGEKIYIDLTSSFITRSDNSQYYIFIIKDVSERIDYIRRLKESEQHFDAFSNATSEGMMIHDQNSILDFNEKLVDIFQYSSTELTKIDPYILFEKKDIDNVYRNETSENSRFHANMKNKSGETFPVEVTDKGVNWNSNPARLKVIKDITEFKNTEEQIREARERYKSIIDNNIDILCCYSLNYTITFVNTTFLDYFEVSIEETLGRSLFDFFCFEDHMLIKENVEKIIAGTSVTRSLYRTKHENNEERVNDWIDRGIYDGDSLVEIQAVARDVTAYMRRK